MLTSRHERILAITRVDADGSSQRSFANNDSVLALDGTWDNIRRNDSAKGKASKQKWLALYQQHGVRLFRALIATGAGGSRLGV